MDEPPAHSNDFIITATGISLIAGVVVLTFFSAFVQACKAAFFALEFHETEQYLKHENKQKKAVIILLKSFRACKTTLTIVDICVRLLWLMASVLLITTVVSPPPSGMLILNTIVGLCFLFLFTEGIAGKVGKKYKLALITQTAAYWNFMTFLLKPFYARALKFSIALDRRKNKRRFEASEVEVSEALHHANASEKDELSTHFSFSSLPVNQVMQKREDIIGIDYDLTFKQLQHYLTQVPFFRMPVYQQSLDTIRGILFSKDLLPFIYEKDNFEWQKLIRPAQAVKEHARITFVLKTILKERIAIVRNQQGATVGLVTLEDITRRITADVNQAMEENTTGYHRIGDNIFIFDGRTALKDFFIIVGLGAELAESADENQTINSLVTLLKNDLPKPGDVIPFEQFTFTIESVDRQIVKRVRVHVHEQQENNYDAETELGIS